MAHFQINHLPSANSSASSSQLILYVITNKFLKKIHLLLGKLPAEAKHLLLLHILLVLGQGFGTFFINIYFFRQTQDFYTLTIFNLFQFGFIFLGYLPSLVIKSSIQMRSSIQLSFILFVLAYGLLIFLRHEVVNFAFIIGTLLGLAIGLYWSGTHPLRYLSTTDSNRDDFYALEVILVNIATILIPLISGVILAQNHFYSVDQIEFNYQLLFAVSLLFFAVGLIYSLKLPKLNFPKYSLLDLWQPFKLKIWKYFSISALADGFKGGTEGFITSILIFTLLDQELSIGIYSSIFGLIGIIIAFFLALKLNRHNRLKFGFLGAMLLTLVHLIYIFFFSLESLLISSIISLFAIPLFTLGLISTFFDAIDHTKNHNKDFYLYIAFRELPLTLGRVLGIGLFLFAITLGDDLLISKIWFLLLGLIPLFSYLYVKKFEEIIAKQELAH